MGHMARGKTRVSQKITQTLQPQLVQLTYRNTRYINTKHTLGTYLVQDHTPHLQSKQVNSIVICTLGFSLIGLFFNSQQVPNSELMGFPIKSTMVKPWLSHVFWDMVQQYG